ncbi:4Fe-4S ferredoxin [Methylovirgula ligni]|uniref:4Fe-4S binding protein n=1 Tax=Methylovirgula ligni TaxID=569860 RepID=A0A3D9YWR6_9HYPH|nr:SCP2 sterol-binding domain-containing protein [Methylovirgula ligni]QAY96287.1 4Fe-4S ferredoxin [Methylovirgula ligni]REF86003.1 4Fe-4S binding protein [Methylovirgula ligni]
MTTFAEHPTVQTMRARAAAGTSPEAPSVIDADWLRNLCLEAGADDVGFVAIESPDIAAQKAEIIGAFAATKAMISFVCRMNRENIRTPARSIANVEFHRSGDEINDTARHIVSVLQDLGIVARNGAPVGFPMEADRWGSDKMWVVSHKPVAVAAGLGRMGIHRNVIHPKFGNFILLGTILVGTEISAYGQPLDYNPCLSCKLCVAACPTGAISPDGAFNFQACYTHNYREFMGGFGDWVETMADAHSAKDYRRKVSDSETISMWQSLSFGANYKAAYCLSVCPAGEDVIGPFLADRIGFNKAIVEPLRAKQETVYVAQNSDAEAYVPRHFPHKTVKRVASGLPRQTSIRGFLSGMPLVFQRGRAKDLNATYHFTFTGREEVKATVVIADKKLRVIQGHEGDADLSVTADSETWLRFLRKEAGLPFALLMRRIRMKGSPRLLIAFGRCFPA